MRFAKKIRLSSARHVSCLSCWSTHPLKKDNHFHHDTNQDTIVKVQTPMSALHDATACLVAWPCSHLFTRSRYEFPMRLWETLKFLTAIDSCSQFSIYLKQEDNVEIVPSVEMEGPCEDFWTMSGDFIYRHHQDPRIALCERDEKTFPVPY